MSARQPTKRRPSREQVRAWLNTVIAPIVSATSVEVERASKGNWSFRCGPCDFEFLWPTEKMVASPYLPNLEQLWRYQPKLGRVAGQHDESLGALRRACNSAFDSLAQSDDFRRLAAGVDDYDRPFLAEYVVNGVRDLTPGYGLIDFWKQRGDDFLALRERPALAAVFRQVAEAGATFASYASTLHDEVVRVQRTLADDFRLPAVDPDEAMAV